MVLLNVRASTVRGLIMCLQDTRTHEYNTIKSEWYWEIAQYGIISMQFKSIVKNSMKKSPGTVTIKDRSPRSIPGGREVKLETTKHGHARQMSRDMTKPTKCVCAQRRLRSAWASAQSDQSSLCAQWVAKDPSFLHADSEDSDQTGRMLRLIWVFAGRRFTLLVLSCRGSNDKRTLLLCLQQKRCHFPWYQLFSPPPRTLSSSPVSLVSL